MHAFMLLSMQTIPKTLHDDHHNMDLHKEHQIVKLHHGQQIANGLRNLFTRQFCASTGACHHALGYHQEAVHDYEKAFSIDGGNKEKVSDEARSQQFLAFYQKELALYIRKHLDTPIAAFCLDKDLHPIFKVCLLAPGLVDGPR